MTLGTTTDTQDSTGKIIFEGDPAAVTETKVKSVLASFVGEQQQVPPMYSAKKSKGIPLYKLARSGITTERKPVAVHFYSIDFVSMIGNRVVFEAHCSAGTYLRTLCHDVGKKLTCGAHMSQLVRKQVGVFDQESSVTIAALETANGNGKLASVLFPVEKVLEFLPEIRINDDFVEPLAHGNAPPKSSLKTCPREFKPGMMMRVCNGDDKVLAIIEPLVDHDQFAQLAEKDIAFKLKRVLI